MTGNELIIALQKLSPEQRELPVRFEDKELYDLPVETIEIRATGWAHNTPYISLDE